MLIKEVDKWKLILRFWLNKEYGPDKNGFIFRHNRKHVKKNYNISFNTTFSINC